MIGGNKLISPDLPITKSTEDKLNRGEFAKSLAKTISQYSFPSSFTIGLYGEWGSGKTSLLRIPDTDWISPAKLICIGKIHKNRNPRLSSYR